MQFSPLDLFIVLIYLALSVAFGVWIGRRQRSTTDYFLAGKQIPWPAAAFSIVATETSVLTFIGVPAVSYLGNMTFLQLAIGYIIGRVLIALVFIPAYYKGNLETAYHFLGDRFGAGMRKTASITFMVTRILADGVRLFATAVPLSIIIKSSGVIPGMSDAWFYAISIVIIGLLTMAYTYAGGIRAVIWMDVAQMTIYVGGAIIAGFLILDHLPQGWNTLTDFSGIQEKFIWLRSGFDLSFSEFIKQPYTFLTAVIGGTVFGLASHGTDQLIVQRVLTCKDKLSSQKAMVVSGVAVFLQFALFLLLGVLLFAFYAGQSPDALGLTRGDEIFPKFILEEIPTGLNGLIVAALFAAAMSTLSSSLSSLASATILDIYVPLLGSNKSEADLLKISRRVTLVWGMLLMGVGLAFIGLEGTVVEVALGIASYTYGGLLGVFLFGLISKKAKQRDAITGFLVGLICLAVMIQTIQIAWPLYTLIGAVIVILTGFFSAWLRTPKLPGTLKVPGS